MKELLDLRAGFTHNLNFERGRNLAWLGTWAARERREERDTVGGREGGERGKGKGEGRGERGG